MANSADPDQLASEEANWTGSTLFAKAGYIRIQQDKGFKFPFRTIFPAYTQRQPTNQCCQCVDVSLHLFQSILRGMTNSVDS